jgi:hypothetical protein
MRVYAIDSFAEHGCRAMMDFGLAGLFERFEREFGQWAARWLLALIGLTIVAVCCSLIVSSIYPVILWTTKTWMGSHIAWIVAEVLRFIFVIGMLTSGCYIIASAIESNQILKEVKSALRDSEEITHGALDLALHIARSSVSCLERVEEISGSHMPKEQKDQIFKEKKKLNAAIYELSDFKKNQPAEDDGSQLQLDISP